MYFNFLINLLINTQKLMGFNSALHLAAMGGHTECCRALIRLGADANILEAVTHFKPLLRTS